MHINNIPIGFAKITIYSGLHYKWIVRLNFKKREPIFLHIWKIKKI